MASNITYLLLLLSCAASTEVLSATLMRPSCATGWFYYKSYCYGYFRKLRNWSDAEVRTLARAWKGFSKARDHPKLQISCDAECQVPPWHSERSGLVKWREEDYGLKAFNFVSIHGACALCQTLERLQRHKSEQ
uniref:Rerating family member 4 n=2 Tax=Sus scrofa TaxID=9823 RepID=A0A4X1TC86_PIG